jgi:hypothetical protein
MLTTQHGQKETMMSSMLQEESVTSKIPLDMLKICILTTLKCLERKALMILHHKLLDLEKQRRC